MSTPAIRASGLHKHYGSLRAVDGLDLEIAPGEVFALLGPNGAGKSTTVEILEGFRRRTAGEVEVLGHDPARPTRAWRERLGIMLQSTSATSLLTAREAVYATSRLYPNPRDVDETLEAVGLTEKAKAQSRTLSGGQRRRLDVALAVVGNPDLIFLDEPTTGFDPEARRRFWTLIESLQDSGATIVLTTHYLDEAEYLADRVAVIAKGRLVALDTPKGLRSLADGAVVKWREGTHHREVTTPTPTATVRELMTTHDGEIEGLEIYRPSLEDVYLGLVGADALDDAEPAEGGDE